MKLEDAKLMCESLMKHHGVYGYKFTWLKRMKKFNRAGQINYSTKEISLQPTFVELNYPAVVKWTILHELAHAMWPKNGHGSLWRKSAQIMGDDGKRCYGKYVKKN